MKKYRILRFFTAFGLAFSLMIQPVYATSIKNRFLTVTQKVDTIAEKEQKQNYTIEYKSDGNMYEFGTKLKITIEEGFVPESIQTGNWLDYEDGLILSVFEKDKKKPLLEKEVEENATIDLTDCKNASIVCIQTVGATKETTDVSKVVLDGLIFSEKTKDKLITSVECLGSSEKEKFVSIEKQELKTDCTKYAIQKPVISIDKEELKHLDALTMKINGLEGHGFYHLNSFTINIPIPSRMIVDRITLPTFEKGAVSLFIDDSERKISEDGTYNVGSVVSEIKVVVKAENVMKQLTDMTVEMRNTLSFAGEEHLKADVTAYFEKEAQIQKESDKVKITYLESSISEPDLPTDPEVPEYPIPPAPEYPTEPEAPQKPQPPVIKPEPEKPTTPSKPQEEPNKKPVVDLSGLNLQGQSAKADGGDNILASVEQTESARTQSLHKITQNRVQETKVFNFTNNTESTKKIEADKIEEVVELDEEYQSEEKPADEIAKSKAEETTEKVKESVSDNRILPVFLLILAMIILATGIVFFFTKEKDEKEEDEFRDSVNKRIHEKMNYHDSVMNEENDDED